MTDVDAMDELKAMAADGNRRRNQARLTMTILFVVALLQIASTATAVGFVISWRHQDHTQSQKQAIATAVSAQRATDLYAKENDTNNVVHVLAGQPLAPPIIPPPVATSTTTTTTTTTTTVPVRRPVPSTTPPDGRTPPSTGGQPSPPATGPPATSQPTPTTTTPRQCVLVILDRCLP